MRVLGARWPVFMLRVEGRGWAMREWRDEVRLGTGMRRPPSSRVGGRSKDFVRLPMREGIVKDREWKMSCAEEEAPWQMEPELQELKRWTIGLRASELRRWRA